MSIRSGVIPQKQMGPHCLICKKTVLAHKFWDDNQYLGSLKPRTVLQGSEPITFFEAQSLLGRDHFSFGGAQAVIWGGTSSKCPPWRPAWLDNVHFAQLLALVYIVNLAIS